MKMISTISYVAAAVVGYMEVVPDGCVVINWSSFVPNPIARFIMTPFIVSKAVSVHECRPLTRRATTSHTDAVQHFHTQCPSHLIHSPSSPLLSNSVITSSNSFGPALISQLLHRPQDQSFYISSCPFCSNCPGLLIGWNIASRSAEPWQRIHLRQANQEKYNGQVQDNS